MTHIPPEDDAAGLELARRPEHVAIIMDGNGRWAQSRGLPRTVGHKQGADAVRRCLTACRDLDIRYLTLFGFSSENWSRPDGEVRELMRLMRHYLRSELAELHKNGIRLRVIGDRTRLADDIVALIEKAEALTAENDEFHLTVAISYGGRQEIVTLGEGICTPMPLMRQCFPHFWTPAACQIQIC